MSSETNWKTGDRILFGVVYSAMAGGILLHAISCIIEACRSRPKVEMIVLGIKQPEKPGPNHQPDESPESPSAPE